MKLITLNIWGGHLEIPLLNFIKDYQDVDVFCFQEVYHRAEGKISNENRQIALNIFSQLQALLPEHHAFFCPTVAGVYGIGMFVKKPLTVLREGSVVIHDNPQYSGMGPAHSRHLQWLECRNYRQSYAIINVHGLWNGMGKTDTAERLAQSQKIREFMDVVSLPKILCGDFNLRPDTKSLLMLEKDMNNLIKLYKVSSTRTSYYPKEEKFADYIFTSPEIMVNSFSVLDHEVSDHSPLFLDFD
jgi:endonuclease/exonuclease/phosphatase family metal-dependent hydrolase